ncbi:hypothetical protein Vretifemale_5397, partial [Volvox reticuliferus]
GAQRLHSLSSSTLSSSIPRLPHPLPHGVGSCLGHPPTAERSESSAAYMSADVGVTPASIRNTDLRGALLPSPLAPAPFNVEVIDCTASSSAIGQEEVEDNMEALEFPREDTDLPDELLDDLPNPDNLLRLQTRKRCADCLVAEDDPKREEGPLKKRQRIIGCFGNKTSGLVSCASTVCILIGIPHTRSQNSSVFDFHPRFFDAHKQL